MLLGGEYSPPSARGCLNERGKPFNPKSVAVMLAARAH